MPTSLSSVAAFSDQSAIAPFSPEQHPSKAAAFWLRRDVVRGVFRPMERLKVAPLAQFYGVGHSPVREAILLLSSSGLVVHEHLKGYRVAPVSLADYDDVVSIYQRLYKLALSMAIDLGDEAWEERVVVQLHRSAKVPVAQPDADPEARETWQRAYWELHGQLLSGCDSPLLLQLLGDIGFRLERYVNLFATPAVDEARDLNAEHREIVDALVARDRERVLGLTERYFASAQPMRDSIVAALRRGGVGRPASRRSAKDDPARVPRAAE